MGRLRIIAGSLRRRRIAVPAGERVRPTPDRVREALFAMLGERVRDARILDAFAGSGALGLEALSRGAVEVVFVESDRGVARVLRDNVSALGLEGRSRIVVADAVRALLERRIRGPFDLILADPPYRGSLALRFAAAVAAGSWLIPGGLLVLERPARAEVPEGAGPALPLARSTRYGDTRIDVYEAPRPT